MWKVVVYFNKEGGQHETTKVTGDQDPFDVLKAISKKNKEKKCVLLGNERIRQTMIDGEAKRNVDQISVYIEKPTKSLQKAWETGGDISSWPSV